MKKRDLVKNYSRRSVLKTLGATAAAPFLPILSAEAATDAPKRILFITTPSGLGPGATPTGSGQNYENGSAFKVLDEHKSDINIYRGIDFKAYGTGFYAVPNSHPALAPHLLTAAITELDPTATDTNAQVSGYHSQGISIDQMISQRFMDNEATRTGMPFIHAGVRTSENQFHRQVYSAPGRSLYPQINAPTLQNRIFDASTTGGSATGAFARRIAERRSVIDNAKAEIDAVMKVLSAVDKERMEAHLDGIRDLEQQLQFQEQAGSLSCANPILSSPAANAPDDDRYRVDGENMLALIVQGLACDRSRVATLQWATAADNTLFSTKGVSIEHHALTHGGIGAANKIEGRNKVAEWYAERFKFVIEKMKAIKEGDNTLLDNTLVVWTSEHSNDGNIEHNRKNIPFITAGSACGAIKTGEFFDFSNRRYGHDGLYTTFAQAMGLTDIEKVGNLPAQVSDTVIPGILA